MRVWIMVIDEVETKRELKPHQWKKLTGNYIKFSIDSNIVYCLIGFEHSEIMENLGVNHLIFYDKTHLPTFYKQIKKLLWRGFKR